MIKIVATLIKVASFSQEEFSNYWLMSHGPLVRDTLPGLRKYVINTRIEIPNKQWDYDGIAELWFDDIASVKKAFASEAANKIREDERKFLKSINWIMTRENLIVDRCI